MTKPEALKNWRKTTLWFKFISEDTPVLELKVWHPRYCSDKERIELLAKHASQGITIIRKMTESKK